MDDHREGIQVEKPVPPWERPGSFRMDCEPHRGDMLWWLAIASLILGILAVVPWCGWMPGLFGIPFNLSLVYLTRADLAKMRAGLMDPAGKTLTSAAKKWSIEGLTLSLVGTIFWGGFVLILLWHSPR